MNRTQISSILAIIALPLLASLQACQEEELVGKLPDKETLMKQGRYLAASKGDAASLLDEPDFPAGTPYRLLAFVKPYAADQPTDETVATHPRFNKVAWEGDIDGLRYINMASEPDKWLGFKAINSESGGSDNLVSLDFYGFTYGNAEDHTSGYIPIDGLNNETTPDEGSLETLKHTETVSNGKLKDLFRGQIFNQNISTVGNSASVVTQSIMPFSHCFSWVQFMVVQQPKENTEDEPSFNDIYIDKIELTNTYSAGAVYLQDGKIELLEENKCNRTLELRNNTAPVATTQTEIGSMIVFPSDQSALKNMPDGYVVGLNITVKGSDQDMIDKFLANSGSTAKATKGDDNYWYGTITREHITNRFTNTTLYFKQNTAYTLLISFQDDAVRIITLVPQIAEWLNGEGTPDFPWQGQPLGQPQMFDNIVWSDRNLGADHYNPKENFEYAIGYFYQSGRNIPYYPFDTEKYAGSNHDFPTLPTPAEKYRYPLADTKSYNYTRHRFYPMVDEVLLNMYNQKSGWNNDNANDLTWIMPSSQTPQMVIPETKPTDAYFDFIKSDGQAYPANYKDMEWINGQQNQPVTGSWVLPSSDDFLSIFPSTPFAGNITFRAGGDSSNPLGWGGHPNDMNNNVKTIRVTVPYYYAGMTEEDGTLQGRSDKYMQAWMSLKNNNDAGTTKEEHYTNVRYHDETSGTTHYNTPGNNSWNEPNGDPEDGYASVYIISRDGDDEMGLDGIVANNKDTDGQNKYNIKTWGTIYGIKRIYTPEAYRMRWRVFCVVCYGESTADDEASAGLYVEICRYRCSPGTHLNENNFKTDFDWEHPAARLYFPICGLGDWTGKYINFGTECQYATCDQIVNGWTGALHMKITGHDNYNAYMAVIKSRVSRDFGKQIRPIGGGKTQ